MKKSEERELWAFVIGIPFLIWLFVIDWKIAICIFMLTWSNNIGFRLDHVRQLFRDEGL